MPNIKEAEKYIFIYILGVKKGDHPFCSAKWKKHKTAMRNHSI